MSMLKKTKIEAVMEGLQDDLTQTNEPDKWRRIKAITDTLRWVLGKTPDLKIDATK